MANTMDKLAKELKSQMNASDARKPKPYDAQAEVLRVEDGVAWVHIPGGVEETPVRLTINAKKGDMVNIRVANGTAWITGNSTNPPTDDSTANYAVDISNEVKKDVTILNTVVAEEIEATNARFGNVEADTAKIHNLTANQLTAAVGYIGDLVADNISASDISADHAMIEELDVESMAAATAYIRELKADDIEAEDIVADHATVGDLDVTYAQINAANVTDLSAQNAWVNKIMVQTGLLAHEGTVFTLDAIQVNAANITAGTIDVNRLIVTVDGEKYLVEIDPTTHQPSYEKLDGNVVEPRTITADKIVAHDITVQEITTENLVGTNGWINLNQGKFFYTTNGSTWANTTNGIMWDGTNLKIKGDVNITAGNVYTKTQTDTALGGKVGNNEVITKINASSEGVQIQAAKVDIAGAAVFNNYSTTTQMNTAIGNAVDGIEVGGRNLFLKTRDYDNYNLFIQSGDPITIISSEPTDILNFPDVTAGSTNIYQAAICRERIPYLLIRDKPIIFSCYIKVANGVTTGWFPQLELYEAKTGGSRIGVTNRNETIVGTGEWVKITQERTVGDDTWNLSSTPADFSTCYVRMSFWKLYTQGYAAGFQVKEFKWEIGNKATDWTPAPEDVQAEIDAKKSVHTLSTSYSYSYENLLTYSAEGYNGGAWTVSSTSGVKVGDTVRLKCTVSNMSNAPVYVVGTVTSVDSATALHMTSHGLDTTIIDGGNILTNSIGANQIKAHSIGASKLIITDDTNLITVTELDANSLQNEVGTPKIENGYLIKNTATQAEFGLTPKQISNFKQNDEIYFELRIKAAAAGNVRFGIWGYDASGAYISGSFVGYTIAATTSEQFISNYIKLTPAVWTDTVKKYVIGVNDDKTTKSQLYIRQAVARRKNAGELIVDGSVTAGKIAADAITIGKMPTADKNQILNSNISVGGRNLVWDTEWSNTASRWHSWGSPTTREIVTLNGKSWLHLVTTTTAYQGYEQNESLRLGYGEVKGGDVLIASFTAYSQAAGQRGCIGVHWRNSSGSIVSQDWMSISLTTTPTRYVSSAWTVPSGAVGFNIMVGDNSTSACEIWIAEVKLEKGNKATDWSPAPEDIAKYTDESIQNLSASVQGDINELSNDVDGRLVPINDALSRTALASDLQSLDDRVSQYIGSSGYIRSVGSNMLELGTSNRAFTLLLSPSEIDFAQSGNVVAYISSNKLFIRNSEVINEMRIGNFVWTTGDGNRLTLKYSPK